MKDQTIVQYSHSDRSQGDTDLILASVVEGPELSISRRSELVRLSEIGVF